MNNRKRLIFLASRVPWPPISGERLKNRFLIPELAKYFDLTLIIIGTDPLESDARHWLRQFGPVHYFNKSRLDYALNLASSPVQMPNPIQTSFYYFPEVQHTVNKLAPSHDAIFCSLIRTARYAEDLPMPRVCDLSDSIGLHYRHSIARIGNPLRRFAYSIEAKLLLCYEAKILGTFDQSFFLNHEEMRHFGRPDKATWVPLGCKPDLLTREDSDEGAAKSLIFLGKMNYEPNVLAAEWFAHEVMPLLPAHLHFKIIGVSPSSRVRALASERIEVTGFLPDPYPVMRGGLAVVAPMLTGGGIQNKLLEAMAMGCLTVNTPHAIRALENVRPDIHLLVADTPAEFASTIRSIDANPSRYARIGPAAREYIRSNFTWTRSGQIYSDAIERAIETHKPRVARESAYHGPAELHGREPAEPRSLFRSGIMNVESRKGLDTN
jgi:glycosyltransferase involved in cell wall biosynthesis